MGIIRKSLKLTTGGLAPVHYRTKKEQVVRNTRRTAKAARKTARRSR